MVLDYLSSLPRASGEFVNFNQDVKAKEVTHLLELSVVCSKYHRVRALGPEFARFLDIIEVLTDVESF